MPAIDGTRLLRDLYAVREIGKYKTGVHRPTFSPQDVEARHWLAARLTEAKLDTSIDGIGNVYGRDPTPGRKLLVGSHLETQNHAGWLDGVMGVIFGLGGRPLARTRHRCRKLGRRGGPFWSVPRQPVILWLADRA
jgi:N-carbamoyl-L-amino-acid hydrolase